MTINLVLSIKNTTCTTVQAPVGTVNPVDITDTGFMITNFNSKGCYNGDLYARVEVLRGIKQFGNKWTHMRMEFIEEVQLGTLECDPTCMKCSDPSPSSCTICNSGILDQGSCVTVCPAMRPFLEYSKTYFNGATRSTNYCTDSCQYGFYPHPDTKICTACNRDCASCVNNDVASCLTCKPKKFSLGGACFDECPPDNYQIDYINYRCVKTSENNYMRVEIQPLGFRQRFRKDRTGYLKAQIQNLDTSKTITQVKWYQLDPLPATSSVTIWTDNSGLVDTGAVVKLKMSAFSFMSLEQSIKIKVEVTNSAGQIATNYTEFYVNNPPREANTLIQRSGGENQNEAKKTLFTTSAVDWVDEATDPVQMLEFGIYFEMNNLRYLVTGYSSANTHTFTLPYLSQTASSEHDVKICVSGIDRYDAQESFCQDFDNMKSNWDGDLSFLTDSVLNFTNENDILVFSQNLNFVMPGYRRGSGAPHLCTLDYHCNFHGTCTRLVSQSQCVCDIGYFGAFCSLTKSEYEKLQERASLAIDHLTSKYVANTNMSPFEIEYICNVLLGLLQEYDVVPESKSQAVIDLLKVMSEHSFTSFFPLEREQRKIVLEAYGRGLSRLLTQQKIEQAKTRHLHSSEKFGQEREDLIVAQKVAVGSSQNLFDTMINSVINKISMSLNPGLADFIYRNDDIFEIKLSAGYPTAFYGKTLTIKNNDMNIVTPADLTSNQKEWASDQQEVKMKLIKWISNPVNFKFDQSYLMEMNITEFTLLNTAGDPIVMDNLTTPITVKDVYHQTTTYPEELIMCKIWNDATQSFDETNGGAVRVVEDVLPCSTCNANSIITTNITYCRFNHMSRFAVTYDPMGVSEGEDPGVGIYTNSFSLKYWSDSFGFNCVLASVTIFGMLIIATSVIDIRPRQYMLLKMEHKIQSWVDEQAFDGEDGLILPNDSSKDDAKKKGNNKIQPGKKKILMKKD